MKKIIIYITLIFAFLMFLSLNRTNIKADFKEPLIIEDIDYELNTICVLLQRKMTFSRKVYCVDDFQDIKADRIFEDQTHADIVKYILNNEPGMPNYLKKMNLDTFNRSITISYNEDLSREQLIEYARIIRERDDVYAVSLSQIGEWANEKDNPFYQKFNLQEIYHHFAWVKIKNIPNKKSIVKYSYNEERDFEYIAEAEIIEVFDNDGKINDLYIEYLNEKMIKKENIKIIIPAKMIDYIYSGDELIINYNLIIKKVLIDNKLQFVIDLRQRYDKVISVFKNRMYFNGFDILDDFVLNSEFIKDFYKNKDYYYNEFLIKNKLHIFNGKIFYDGDPIEYLKLYIDALYKIELSKQKLKIESWNECRKNMNTLILDGNA